MKFNILPGQHVVMHQKIDSSGRTSPSLRLVHSVNRGILDVSESDSINGLAQITCHSSSHKDGTYWYQYKEIESGNMLDEICGKSIDILHLEDAGGNQIKVGSFIED